MNGKMNRKRLTFIDYEIFLQNGPSNDDRGCWYQIFGEMKMMVLVERRRVVDQFDVSE